MGLTFLSSDPDSYGNRMARRKGVYNWLRETNEQATNEEVSSCSDKDYLQALFSLVSGQQLSSACRLAQRHRDHKLALLLSQATQNTTYNKWVVQCTRLCPPHHPTPHAHTHAQHVGIGVRKGEFVLVCTIEVFQYFLFYL